MTAIIIVILFICFFGTLIASRIVERSAKIEAERYVRHFSEKVEAIAIKLLIVKETEDVEPARIKALKAQQILVDLGLEGKITVQDDKVILKWKNRAGIEEVVEWKLAGSLLRANEDQPSAMAAPTWLRKV